MSGGEGVVTTLVRSFFLDGVLQAVDGQCHDASRKGIGDNHSLPGTTSLYARCLQPQHYYSGRVLQVIVVMESETGGISVAHVTETLVVLISKPTDYNQWRRDVSDFIDFAV